MEGSGPAARGLTTRGAGERLVHDAPDGAGAPAALGAAAQAPIDVAGRSRRGFIARQSGAHVLVGQHVAGTDDHSRGPAADWYHLQPFNSAGEQAVQEEILVLSGSNLPTDKLITRWKWIYTKTTNKSYGRNSNSASRNE